MAVIPVWNGDVSLIQRRLVERHQSGVRLHPLRNGDVSLIVP